MKLEAGKQYIRRDGSLTPPLVLESYEDGISLFQDTGTNYVFSQDDDDGESDGLVFTSDLHDKDLVAEYIPDTEVPEQDSTKNLAIPEDVLKETMAAATGVDGVNTDALAVETTISDLVKASESIRSPILTIAERKASVDSATLRDKNDTISATLDARGTNYGDFHTQAAISQELSDAMVDTPKWSELSSGQREALQMIQHKIARILNGNPLYLDSWVDIVGYAELGKRETERLGGK